MRRVSSQQALKTGCIGRPTTNTRRYSFICKRQRHTRVVGAPALAFCTCVGACVTHLQTPEIEGIPSFWSSRQTEALHDWIEAKGVGQPLQYGLSIGRFSMSRWPTRLRFSASVCVSLPVSLRVFVCLHLPHVSSRRKVEKT